MPLDSGTKLGPYEITEPLGKGGMGVVYLARDPKLDRDVAIKALPDDVAGDAGRLARFQREAKLLASLHHSNIAAVYGLEECDGTSYLILEYIDGEDLSTRLRRGPLPVDEALDIARQIAEALEAAHEKGIIHRDLKPGNIRLTADGQVKVLDFGLAKALSEGGSSISQMAAQPTMTADESPTIPGVILGTAGYMSPEQARGKAVDRRSDIFAFGCVLYEMLTGKRTFPGENATDSMGATLHAEVDWSALPADTPPTVQLLLRRCLTKDRKRRLHDIADARVEIEEAIADPSASSLGLASAAMAGVGRARGRSALGGALPWVAGIMLGVVGTWFAVRGGAPVETDIRPMRFEIPLQTAKTVDASPLAPHDVVIAPDGSAVVIEVAGADQPLYLREMNSLETRVLVGTEGGESPFFSPDGRWVGFYNSGRIMRIPREGGAPIPVCATPSRLDDAAWLDGGTIVVRLMDTSDLQRTKFAGGELTLFCSNESRPDVLGFQTICRVPGQRYVLAGAFTGNAIEANTIVAVSRDDGSIETIIPNGSNPAITADGHLVYLRGSSLYAVRFDLDDRRVLGAETRVIDSIAAGQWGGNGYFALAPTGTLAYVPGKRFSVGRRLVWVDRTGGVVPLSIEPDAFVSTLALSADGNQIAFNTLRQGLELWAYDITRKTRRSLNTEGECYDAVWDPTGRRLTYSRITPALGYEHFEIIVRDLLDGSTQTLPLEPLDQHPQSWLPDGEGILFGRNKPCTPPQSDSDILLFRFGAEEPLETILATEHSEFAPTLSHDGNWMAYVSDENGRDQVFLRAFPDDGRKRQVSFSGVREGWIAWAADDGELYWIADDHVLAAAIKTEPELDIGVPEKLFASPWPLAADRWAAIDVAPDGRFLMIQPAEWENRVRHVRVVLNWNEELKERLAKADD